MGSAMKFDKSNALLERASKVAPYGTHSSARIAALMERFESRVEFPEIKYPKFFERSRGSHIYDCDGNDFIDYMMGLGPVILGHANSKVNEAVRMQLDDGVIFGTCHEMEIKVSEKLAKHVPCAELSAMMTTGSDATLAALRLSRAYNGKEKVARFQGHYHSWHDWMRFSDVPAGHTLSVGIPPSVQNDVVILPWNEPAVLQVLRKRGNEIAAVICEAVIGNLGCIMPVEGYLEELREVCDEQNIVLIFDEVVTGFRLGLGGAQKKLGVTPDLTTFAKAMANGFPIAAVVGKKEVMMSKALLGGTYNSNPVSCAAALATISELEDEKNYAKINNAGKTLMKGFRDAIRDVGIEAVVQGYEPLFSILFTDKDSVRLPRDLASVPFHPHIRRAAVFYQEMVNRGVYNLPTRASRWCLSTAHEREDIEKTIEAAGEALRQAKKIA
jgi:glutamate-1-semialdehyde 2,1-aminomutase